MIYKTRKDKAQTTGNQAIEIKVHGHIGVFGIMIYKTRKDKAQTTGNQAIEIKVHGHIGVLGIMIYKTWKGQGQNNRKRCRQGPSKWPCR